jgi:hypothetical protein
MRMRWLIEAPLGALSRQQYGAFASGKYVQQTPRGTCAGPEDREVGEE